MGRGGARPGAGRKRKGTVAICWKVKSDTAEGIRRVAKDTGKSCGEVVDFVFCEYEKREAQE